MKINEVTVEFILNYLHEDPDDAENRAIVSAAMPAAKALPIFKASSSEIHALSQ